MTNVTKELEASFERVSKTALRIKAERDMLLTACKLAWTELDNRYDVDQNGERVREFPFNGAGEVIRALRAAIDKVEQP